MHSSNVSSSPQDPKVSHKNDMLRSGLG